MESQFLHIFHIKLSQSIKFDFSFHLKYVLIMLLRSVFAGIQIGPTKTATLLISTIEIRGMVTKHHKSAARLLDRDCVNRQGLDLSKEVLWVSVCQRAAELPAVKVGGKKKFC